MNRGDEAIEALLLGVLRPVVRNARAGDETAVEALARLTNTTPDEIRAALDDPGPKVST